MLDEDNLRYIADGKIIELNRAETVVLSILIKEKGKFVSRYLLEWVLTHNIVGNRNYGATTIKRLREKLDGILEIKTKRGKGYYIN